MSTASDLGDETARAWRRVGELQVAGHAKLEAHLDLMEMRLEAHDGRFDHLERELTTTRSQLARASVAADQRLSELDRRLDELHAMLAVLLGRTATTMEGTD